MNLQYLLERRMQKEYIFKIKDLEKNWVIKNLNKKFNLVYDFGSGLGSTEIGIVYDKYVKFDRIRWTSDTVIIDLEKEFILDKKADLIICVSVLEHTWDFNTVIKNIYNNLNGEAIIVVPYIYEYHGNIDVPDYHRFTPEGIIKLIDKLSILKFEFIGQNRELIGILITNIKEKHNV